jgi:hypothetical protein
LSQKPAPADWPPALNLISSHRLHKQMIEAKQSQIGEEENTARGIF